MGRYDDGNRLRDCGVVELGFRSGERQLLMDLVESVRRETSPFVDAVIPGAVYAEPAAVAVRFLECSEWGTLRHASLQRVSGGSTGELLG